MARPNVVVITGASAGVGRATALAFARRGSALGLLARDTGALTEVKAEVEAAGGRAVMVPTDVADCDEVEAAADEVEDAFGPIDAWINNAMATIYAPLLEIGPEEFRRATEVTYLGVVHGTMAALKRMKPRNAGSIVQVGSALAFQGIPLQAPYCGAKFAIRGFTHSVRAELRHDRSRVHVGLVHLPAVNTPQFDWGLNRLPKKAQPVPPIYQPEVPARAIVWAARHRRRELWVGASTVQLVLASRLAPWLLERMLAHKTWSGQMRDEPADPARPSNLYTPVHGLHATHGSFDRQARESSPQLWLAMNRTWLVPLVLLPSLGILVWFLA